MSNAAAVQPRAALIVGAAGGVGAATTSVLLAAGWRVIATVLDEAERTTVLQTMPGVSAVAILDLSRPDEIASKLADLLENETTVEAVVVCAAIPQFGPLEQVSLDVVRQVFNINVLSNLAVYQATLPVLRRTKGKLILLSSNAERCPIPFIGIYVASKHALGGLGDVMRQEAALSGVQVVLVQPGAMKTGMADRQLASLSAHRTALPPDMQSLYGGYYRGFEEALTQIGVIAMSPQVVANAIVEVLSTSAPKTRYVVGKDAEDSLAARRDLPDETLDAIYHQAMFKP